MKDGHPFTFAGLWENRKDPQTDEWIRTCTIITGESNVSVRATQLADVLVNAPQYHPLVKRDPGANVRVEIGVSPSIAAATSISSS
jgi:SOS response associated peptidase (SRAP)